MKKRKIGSAVTRCLNLNQEVAVPKLILAVFFLMCYFLLKTSLVCDGFPQEKGVSQSHTVFSVNALDKLCTNATLFYAKNMKFIPYLGTSLFKLYEMPGMYNIIASFLGI